MRQIAKVGAAVGTALVVAALGYHWGKKSSEAIADYVGQLQHRLQTEVTAAPPGWDYCTMPSYYIRACEAGPFTRRWAGTVGYVGQICGAHTIAYMGEDGFVYPIIDQPPATGTYKAPPPTAATARAAWIECFVNHTNAWPFTGYNCAGRTPPGGSQVYNPIVLAQVPIAQRSSFCLLYRCTIPECPGGATATPSMTPAATLTPTVPPCPSSSPTKTFTPSIQPNRTRTPTPVLGSSGA